MHWMIKEIYISWIKLECRYCKSQHFLLKPVGGTLNHNFGSYTNIQRDCRLKFLEKGNLSQYKYRIWGCWCSCGWKILYSHSRFPHNLSYDSGGSRTFPMAIGWIAMEFGMHIHVPLGMNNNHFGDPLTFNLAPSLHFTFTLHSFIWQRLLSKATCKWGAIQATVDWGEAFET